MRLSSIIFRAFCAISPTRPGPQDSCTTLASYAYDLFYAQMEMEKIEAIYGRPVSPSQGIDAWVIQAIAELDVWSDIGGAIHPRPTSG